MVEFGVDLPPVRCFLSYAHIDDQDFGIVDPLTGLLRAVYQAKTGHRLDVFIDRESIGWGEDWRGEIALSVSEAVVFIPLITARYFERPSCREEFLAFHAKSHLLGVTELLLPVVLMGASLIRQDSPWQRNMSSTGLRLNI